MALNALLNVTMRGVVWEGIPYNVSVHTLPVPSIQAPTDAIVRVRLSGICGSDLHTYHGFVGGPNPPWAMGHEALGVIEAIGEAVNAHGVGDYVVVPDGIDNGTLQMSPEMLTYYGNEAETGGCQSEYVRVPHADANLIPIPLTNSTNSTQELDYLFISDIFATGWKALDFAGFEAGDSVVVFGAGPVGLLAAHSAFIRGASKVYSVDYVPDRLQLASSIGAVPINFVESDPVEQILALEPDGVRRCVDAVGFEALNSSLQMQSDVVLRNMIAVAGFGGGLGVVGVYDASPSTPGNPLGDQVARNLDFPASEFFYKQLSYWGGPVDVRQVAPELVRLIAEGKARPSFIVSSIVGVEDAPQAYVAFSRREETKIVIRFP